MHSIAADWLRSAQEAFSSAVTRGEALSGLAGWQEFVMWHANYDLDKEMADIGVPADRVGASIEAILEACPS